ncbi:MLO-like protein 4 isoform X2 [Phoenix dactylifera]|uniref:MLO-like protein 4 isoform X2 n=1 Tax=Phoenix dactylifera TaxID=42345 RepID=A0A8B9B110_PHODC|nr:MLO-like protein 4 isoform X2 [Phoenix dactylifera]
MMKKQSTFVFQRTSHPWSKNRILIWMLCFIRQFKGSLAKSDYMALRLGFISNHKLPLSYDFHKYMVRSMEDEFHGSVGISWPLWVYGILCIFVNIHGINIYFWLSFVPAILVMLVGTKLQHVVVQLALEVVEATGPFVGTQLKPRDDLFWFGKPELLLWLIQFISFQNAFEMAAFIWSLMGSKFKKSLIAESVRESLHSWCRRVKKKSKREPVLSLLGTATSTCSLESTMDETDDTITVGSGIFSRSSSEVSLEALNTIMMDEQEA